MKPGSAANALASNEEAPPMRDLNLDSSSEVLHRLNWT